MRLISSAGEDMAGVDLDIELAAAGGGVLPGQMKDFFRDIAHVLRSNGLDAADTADVQDEIFDMVKPADPARIRVADLVRCGCGDVVCEMLVDINGFWAYDNRETLVVDEQEDGDAGGDDGAT